jgi:hypothetical protein
MSATRPTTGAPANIFERHAKLTITVVVLVIAEAIGDSILSTLRLAARP